MLKGVQVKQHFGYYQVVKNPERTIFFGLSVSSTAQVPFSSD